MSRKLLVIDDQIEICKAISHTAQRHGFEVQVVDDSESAIAVFLAFAPDVVILDLVMPGRDGIQVLHDLLTSGVPAHIVLTTASGIGDAYVRIAAGVASFHGLAPLPLLRKPFRRADLIEVLNQVPETEGSV
ncbi:MAG TPA: response regulator [Acetobacteraceae bacterium]|jgi:two-component system response regulator MtrA